MNRHNSRCHSLLALRGLAVISGRIACFFLALFLAFAVVPCAAGSVFPMTAYADDPDVDTPESEHTPTEGETGDPADPEGTGDPGGTETPPAEGSGDPSGGSTEGEATEDAFIAGMMIDEIFGAGIDNGSIADPIGTLEKSINSIVTVLEGTPGEDGKVTGGLLNTPIYYAFQGVAITIMIISALSSFITTEMVSQQFGKPTMETVIKPFAKIIVAMIFIINVWAFLKVFLYLSQWAYYAVGDVHDGGGGGMDTAAIKTQIYSIVGYVPGTKKIMEKIDNIVATVSMVLTFFIPWLISLANSVAMVFVVFSRTLNICIRGIMAPLAMTDICSERPIRETKAWGYIMEFCGLCFQSVVILIALIATNYVMGAFIQGLTPAEGFVGGFGQMLNLSLVMAAAKLAQIGVMLGTGNLAKRIFGGQ